MTKQEAINLVVGDKFSPNNANIKTKWTVIQLTSFGVKASNGSIEQNFSIAELKEYRKVS